MRGVKSILPFMYSLASWARSAVTIGGRLLVPGRCAGVRLRRPLCSRLLRGAILGGSRGGSIGDVNDLLGLDSALGSSLHVDWGEADLLCQERHHLLPPLF